MIRNIQTLKTTGMTTVSYVEKLRRAVESGTPAWRAYYSMPKATRRLLSYDGGVGYELKETPGHTLDLKEDFHFSLNGEKWLREAAEKIGAENGEAAAVKELLDSAVRIIEASDELIMDFARQSEEAFGLAGFADEVAASKGARIVRFLHYFGDRNPGEETATAHADKSGFTLHLYESDPGLQCLTFEGKWADMPVSEGETVIIPGMQMQLRSKCELKALCHRVIANEETAVKGRTSMVFFLPLTQTPAYNKEAAGRLQTFEPGFNYTMPMEEFSRLFK